LTKILVVEDDRSLRDALTYNLRREDYTPITAEDAESALILARQESPDLILLDLMLPRGNGFDVCRSIRAFSTAPIIIMTARVEDVDRVVGLEIGADDYVTKPFALRELLARIKANLRRVAMDRGLEDEAPIEHDGLVVDPRGRKVVIDGVQISFQPREFDLLAYFVRHPDTVLSRGRLLSAVWGHEFVGERTVDVHVRRVRAKLEGTGHSQAIRTVHGVGYVFEIAPKPSPSS